MRSIRGGLASLAAGLLIGAGLGLVVFFGFGPGKAFLGQWLPLAPALQTGETGFHASDFTLQSLDGESVHLQDLRGRPVVINFWATWCGPCREEMPLLQRYYERLGDQVGFVAVNFDEPEASVRSFVNELNLTFPVLLDPRAKVTDLYRVRAFPTTYFLDAEGLIVSQHIGTLSEAQLVGYLEKLGVEE